MSRLKEADEGDFSERKEIWAKIYPMINDSPISGMGSTGYNESISKYYYGLFKSPHNVFLEILVYTGIIGFLFFNIFLIYVFIFSYKYFNRYGELLPILLLMPVIGLMLSGQILNVKVIYVIFAYALSRKLYLLNSEKYV